jgi:hypothetical protein
MTDSEEDEMRKMIVNASLALCGTARDPGDVMRETGAERSSVIYGGRRPGNGY